MEGDAIEHKIEKYVHKLKHAKTRKEAETYQEKLQHYHKMNRVGGGQKGGNVFDDLVGQFKDAKEKAETGFTEQVNIAQRGVTEHNNIVNKAIGSIGDALNIIKNKVAELSKAVEVIRQTKEELQKELDEKSQQPGANEKELDELKNKISEIDDMLKNFQDQF